MIELLRLAGSDRTPGLADIALFEGWKARFSPGDAAFTAAEQSRGKGAAVRPSTNCSPRGKGGVAIGVAASTEQRAMEGDGDELAGNTAEQRGRRREYAQLALRL